STIIIMDKETGGTEQWTGFSADKSLKSCYVPYFKHPCHDAQLNAWKKGEEFLVYTLAGDEKRSLDEHYFATGYKVFPESDKRWMRQMESVTFSHAFMKYGAIHWGPNHLTEDQLRILQRFSKVFEQSYTRFLDLQKAEAQARESQIQLAMERVRARTMAMQRSEELAEVATVLFQQVKALGVSQWVCGFSIWETGDKEFTWYPGSPDGEILAPCKVPLTEHPVFISYDESRRRGDELFVYEKEGEFQVDHYRYMMSVPGMRKLLQNMLDAGLSIPSFQIDHIANFSHGNLIFITYEHVPEMHDIFKRFAKVFDQTYTRFLDLQKAEAQAREAQIEAALERVRSRTMGMHKSDELREVVAVLFTQLQHIGFDIKFCSIALIDKINSTVEFWLSGFSQEILPESYHVPNLDHPFYQNFQSTFRQGVPYHVFELAGAEKRSYDKLWFTLTDFKNLPDPVKRPMMEMERVVLSCAFTKNGMIQIGGFEPLSETDATIIQRFAKVFEQTYTRFLDLQKAEAQAREAQIEVALERIRARAMAMHSSNELMDVANILREQMGLLGQPDLETSVVNLFEEDSELIFSWNASRVPGSSEKIMSSTTSFPKNSSELAREMMSLYHSGEKEYTLEAAGLKLMEFLNILIKANPRVADYIGNNPPEKVFYHFTTFTGGNLLTVSYQPPSEETKSLQRRAASVFDMAYRRYRDLKRAEAQAREAQIEAAVEKVRSRSLAMHKSDELQEVVHTVFERLKDLNVDFYTAIIILFKEGSKDIIWWLESKANQQYSRISVPYTPIAYFKDLFDKRESGGDMLSKFYPFDEKNKLFHHLFANTDFKDVPETQKQFLLGAEFVTISVALAGNTGIHISSYSKKSFSDQDNQIIKRFANVFDQAYTRFHDLQKAEAQAREAKIEAALERVRSRTMAMHKSDELAEVATVLFEQMSLLDNTPERFNIRIANEAEGVFEFWATDQEGHLVNKFFRAAFDKSPVVLQMYTSWKAKEKILIQDLHGDQLSEWVHYIRDELGVPFNTKTLKEHRFLSSVFFSHGMIGITTNDTPSP
ncbi:MAG TPA: hypothetical protein VFH07_03165, partial [Chitinophagaceae bacterium]|nr:hypothetical protein [Chitinophagaceae bacterium]